MAGAHRLAGRQLGGLGGAHRRGAALGPEGRLLLFLGPLGQLLPDEGTVIVDEMVLGATGLGHVLEGHLQLQAIAAHDVRPVLSPKLSAGFRTEDLLGGLGDKLNPELVSPLVTYLAHESCEASGRVFSVGGDLYAAAVRLPDSVRAICSFSVGV